MRPESSQPVIPGRWSASTRSARPNSRCHSTRTMPSARRHRSRPARRSRAAGPRARSAQLVWPWHLPECSLNANREQPSGPGTAVAWVHLQVLPVCRDSQLRNRFVHGTLRDRPRWGRRGMSDTTGRCRSSEIITVTRDCRDGRDGRRLAHNPAAYKLQRLLDCADDRVAEAPPPRPQGMDRPAVDHGGAPNRAIRRDSPRGGSVWSGHCRHSPRRGSRTRRCIAAGGRSAGGC